MALRALLWDVDGTLAETERDGHRVAFNQAFEAQGLPWRWSVQRYGELLAVTGGRERLLHDMLAHSDAPATPGEREALARTLHQRKNAFYAALVQGQGIALRPGVLPLLQACRAAGVRLVITTTTGRANVQALLRPQLGAGWAGWFDTLVCGEDVVHKKPDPEVYLKALQQLALAPLDTLALEDSPSGVAAACAAGVPVLVTRSAYFEEAIFEGPGLIAVGPGIGQRQGWRPAWAPDTAPGPVTLADLQQRHQDHMAAGLRGPSRP